MDFPLFKLGKYERIEETLLGKVYIYTMRSKYILDDNTLPYPTIMQRRLHIRPTEEVPLYKFRGTVFTLRQLAKYPSSTVFIDAYGKVFKYKKGKRRYPVVSHKIIRKEKIDYDRWVIHIDKIPSPHLIDNNIVALNTNYISIIHTDNGPLVYDYTNEQHETYRRSL